MSQFAYPLSPSHAAAITGLPLAGRLAGITMQDQELVPANNMRTRAHSSGMAEVGEMMLQQRSRAYFCRTQFRRLKQGANLQWRKALPH